MQKILDVLERVGNKVPHPVVIFLILILILLVAVCSSILSITGASATQAVIVPKAQPSVSAGYEPTMYDTGTMVEYETVPENSYTIETVTVSARSLLTVEGIRFMYSSLIPSFMGFTAVGLLIVAMIGVGVAEEAGLVKALIRMLVKFSPAWALTYILAFVGIISSVAPDAGYLVLMTPFTWWTQTSRSDWLRTCGFRWCRSSYSPSWWRLSPNA